MRVKEADTVVLFDLSKEVCIEGALARVGKVRADMPWREEELDPKYLRGERYTVNFTKDGRAKISVKDIKIIIDFKNQTCSNNSGIHCYGSESWGNNVEVNYCED